MHSPSASLSGTRAMSAPEALARRQIDAALAQAGWTVQDRKEANLHAACGVAIREFPLKSGFGEADYLLFVNRQAVGAVEAKKQGTTLTGVETQSAKYSEGLPARPGAPSARSPSSTRPPASRPTSPTASTPTPAPVVSSPSTAPRLSPSGPPPRLSRRRFPSQHPSARSLNPFPPTVSTPPAPSAARIRTMPPVLETGLLARAAPGRPQPRSLPPCQPPPRPHPDGHRQRQDRHRHHRRLPPRQVCRCRARPLPRRPGKPRPSGPQGVPGLRHAG